MATSGWAGYDAATATPVPGDALTAMQELGIDVIRQTDDEVMGRCPMHLARTGKEDRHPSWSVNVNTGIHNCFSCGYKGNFVQLVSDVSGMERAEAVAWVRKRGGVEKARRIMSKAASINDLRADTTKVINEASLALYTSPPLWALEERHLSSAAANKHGLLWNPDDDTWIIPIRDPQTQALWGWQEKRARYFRNRPYTVKKSKALFGLGQVAHETVILVESPLDVVRITSAGIHGSVSSYGAGVSDDQMRLIIATADVVIVALDNDRDGLKWSEYLRISYAQRIRMKFLNYDGLNLKDPGDMTDEQIHHAVDTAFSSTVARFK